MIFGKENEVEMTVDSLIINDKKNKEMDGIKWISFLEN